MSRAPTVTKPWIKVEFDPQTGDVNVMLPPPELLRQDQAVAILERARQAVQCRVGRPQIVVPKITLHRK